MKLFFQLSLLFFLFNALMMQASPFPRLPSPPMSLPLLKKAAELKKAFSNPHYADLIIAYTTGEKISLSWSLYLQHKKLYLLHLFTPSGLHLSVLLLPLAYFRSKSPQIQKKIISLLIFLISLGLIFLPAPFFALKRIGLLKTFDLIYSHFNENDSFKIFITVFMLDYLWGTYKLNSLSFNLSFIFLGVIIILSKRPKILLWLCLLLAQYNIAILLAHQFNLLGFIFGQIITFIFTFYLIPIFLVFIFPWKLFSLPLEAILLPYCKLLKFLSIHSSYF